MQVMWRGARPLRALFIGLAACGDVSAGPSPSRATAFERAQSPPAIVSTNGRSVVDQASAGSCARAPEGTLACEGKAIVRCDGRGGALVALETCRSIERCSEGVCVPDCPDGEVYIPGTGPEGFWMGKGHGAFGFGAFRSGQRSKGVGDAPHRVILTKPFCIDQTEVTAKEMVPCVDVGKCREPKRTDEWSTYPQKLHHPVNMVDWTTATAYCAFAGKSLPTEAQWEWAATGGDGRPWPWGEAPPNCERADFTEGDLPRPAGDTGCHGGGPSPVGSHPLGAIPWPDGPVHDLAGNVWEWVRDSYEPYRGVDEIDPVHDNPAINMRVVRGGGWNRSALGIKTSFRGGAIVGYAVPGLGFRCVRNAE